MLEEIVLRDHGDPGAVFDTGTECTRESRALKYLGALWALRMMHRHPALLRSRMGFGDECRVLEMTGLPESIVGDSSVNKVIRTVRDRLAEVEAAPVPLVGPLFENIAQLSSLLRLNSVETALLLFGVLLRGNEALDSTFDALGNFSRREMALELANVLRFPADEVGRALRPESALVSSGVLWPEGGDSARIGLKLELLKGLADNVGSERGSIENLFARYFSPAPAARLTPEDYEHLRLDWRNLEMLLRDALEQRSKGTNVLLHGAPGVGKTELARAVGAAIGTQVFEITKEKDDQRSDRLRAFCLAQEILKSRGSCFVLFDEVEDVFPETAHPLFGSVRDSGKDKAWTNELLETNPVPAVWLTNTVRHIDPAFLRRFDYVAEISLPPTSVRERLLRDRLNGLDLDSAWMRSMATCERLVPSEIDRAARLARLAGNDSGPPPDRVFERAVENTQRAMGFGWRAPRKVVSGEEFDYSLVNCEIDLEAITRGLSRTGSGRIALYGPPGTGKSFYARHLSSRLNRPLVQKHASDLLSMWVGETEKLIASMFEQAEHEESLLLLDEADSFLQDRSDAQRQWEISQVNELLTKLESFEGVFVCATNLFDRLDPAVLRRFDLKVRLDYLDSNQVWRLCLRTAKTLGIKEDTGTEAVSLRQSIGRLTNLTPGDFAAVVRKCRVLGPPRQTSDIVKMLAEESRVKPDGGRLRPGFV